MISSWCGTTDSENNVWWGVYNRPFETEKFDALYARLLGYLQGKDVFVQDAVCRCG